MYRLLIVDDNADSVQTILSLLDWSAYGVTSAKIAASYEEGLSLALEEKPHLALVAIRLGRQMGYTLVSQLRTLGLKTAFCMIAQEANPDQIRESMRSGAQDYLLRPLTAGELQGFLARNLPDAPEPQAHSGQTDPVLGLPYSHFSKLTNKIMTVVRSDYGSPQSLASIAVSLDMSSKYIGRVFLKETGMKFSEYLMSYRMLEAKKRIVSSREKISVIAASVGYVQMNNFYIHFKNYFGVSPSTLRSKETSETGSQGESYEELV